MESEKHRALGSWIGLQKAFATVAGSCSAARAQCLKQVREGRLLGELGLTWEAFCKDYAGISRPQADSLIRQYDQLASRPTASRRLPAASMAIPLKSTAANSR